MDVFLRNTTPNFENYNDFIDVVREDLEQVDVVLVAFEQVDFVF